MNLLVLVLLIVLIVGAFPAAPWYGQPPAWGYFPSGIFGIVLLVLLVMAPTGRG